MIYLAEHHQQLLHPRVVIGSIPGHVHGFCLLALFTVCCGPVQCLNIIQPLWHLEAADVACSILIKDVTPLTNYPIACTCPLPTVVHQVYMAASQTPASNLQLLERMVGARREMATAVGCPSYSHFKAAGGRCACGGGGRGAVRLPDVPASSAAAAVHFHAECSCHVSCTSFVCAVHICDCTQESMVVVHCGVG